MRMMERWTTLHAAVHLVCFPLTVVRAATMAFLCNGLFEVFFSFSFFHVSFSSLLLQCVFLLFSSLFFLPFMFHCQHQYQSLTS